MNTEQLLLVGTHAQGLGAMYQVLDRLALSLEVSGDRKSAQEVRDVCAHVNVGVVMLEAIAERGAREANPGVPS